MDINTPGRSGIKYVEALKIEIPDLKNIYAKLHVNSRTEAVIKAMQEKLR